MISVRIFGALAVAAVIFVTTPIGAFAQAEQTDLSKLRDVAAAGDAEAQFQLGEIYLWGSGTPVDLEKAKTLLRTAANNDNLNAMRLLGENLVGGWFLEQDVIGGQALLEYAVEAGDDKAMVALGKFFLYGEQLPKDEPRARLLFEAAAEAGNGNGLQSFGATLMWRGTDPETAEAMLVQSGNMGVGAAWTSLAEGAMYGYLGQTQRRKFDGYAERALALGETKIAVLEAQRRLYGISMRASGPLAVEGLEAAAREGNADAAAFLIQLVRDGNQLNVSSSPDLAETYLSEFSDTLSERVRDRLSFTIQASTAQKPRDFAELAEVYDSRPELKSVAHARDVLATNENFAIYILQRKLRQDGIYLGPLDGFAGRGTIRALWRACNGLPDNSKCEDTVMHPSVIARLIAE